MSHSALYLLNHSATSNVFWECCEQIQYAVNNSALLLLGDATYVMNLPEKKLQLFLKLTNLITVYVLEEDLNARGLLNNNNIKIININYDGFVALTEQHHPIITWR